MGYSDIKSRKQHEADAAKIAELEAQLRREQEAKPETGHVTIEKTSKSLKLRILQAWALFIIGLVGIPVAQGVTAGGGPEWASTVPGLMVVAGVVLWIVTKIQIWWQHG